MTTQSHIRASEVIASGPTSPTKKSTLQRLYIDLAAHFDDHQSLRGPGYLEQKFLYLDPRSAMNWRLLVKCGLYKSYEYCKSSLDDFLEGQLWTGLLDKQELVGICILGAGAPDKDLSIIHSVSSSKRYTSAKRLDFLVVDTSYHMLEYTIREILAVKPKSNASCVLITPVRADFLNMHSLTPLIRLRAQGKVAFFIPGGTLCNINEAHFFRSIAQAARPNDYLIVGLEFATTDVSYEARLKKAYDNVFLRNLVVDPLKLYLDQGKLHLDEEQLRSSIRVDVVRPNLAGLTTIPGALASTIPGTLTVVIRAKVNEEDVVCATSNRYNEGAFKQYAAQFGFQWEVDFASAAAPNFKQVVFKYRGNEENNK